MIYETFTKADNYDVMELFVPGYIPHTGLQATFDEFDRQLEDMKKMVELEVNVDPDFFKLQAVPCRTVPLIDKIIYSNPATIVFWADGTKTVVKCDNEPFSEEHGLAMAYMRKIYSSRSEFKKEIAKAKHSEQKKKDGVGAATDAV